jgi:hypothetical protein
VKKSFDVILGGFSCTRVKLQGCCRLVLWVVEFVVHFFGWKCMEDVSARARVGGFWKLAL